MLSVLDPRISYDALQEDFADDSSLLAQLESSKLNLRLHFDTNYNLPQTSSNSSRLSSTPTSSLLSVTSEPTSTTSNSNGSPQKNYTARYRRKRATVDELTEFWNMPQEDFESCNPVQWWHQRRAQFPNLYRLACNIFSIPGICSEVIFVTCVCCVFIRIIGWVIGSAVAVERIFSGGRDTISLRRASLKAETIRILMLVKRRLVLRRRSAQHN